MHSLDLLFFTRNIQTKYESPICKEEKVMVKVKVFEKQVKYVGQGGIHMQSLKTVSVIVLKLLGEVKVFHADAGCTAIALPDFRPGELKKETQFKLICCTSIRTEALRAY